MAVAFTPGQTVGRGDLDIFLTTSNSNPSDAAEISFALYYVDPGPPETEVLIGSATRTPAHPSVGEYYASLMIPSSATPGTYRIRWTFKEYVSSPFQQVVQEFAVVATGTVTSLPGWSAAKRDMTSKLRLLLRDQNPDKFYHFRPPEWEGDIGQYNRIFGQIWEDAELLEYIERSLDWFNMFPPLTQRMSTVDLLVTEMPAWRTAILWGAIAHACFALAANWIADEFDYSIGGVSLTIEKSSKYESLKQNAEGMFDKATEAKQRTVKFMRGLQQPRFGLGVRSAFGPVVGKGVLSPRSFLVWALVIGSSGVFSHIISVANSFSSVLG